MSINPTELRAFAEHLADLAGQAILPRRACS